MSKQKFSKPLNNYVFNLKAEAIHLSFHFVQNIWKKVSLAHNDADLESLKETLFFLILFFLYVFDLSLLLSPSDDNINDSKNFLLNEEVYFADQKD